jgi:long-chain acyl-CoA synthetase
MNDAERKDSSGESSSDKSIPTTICAAFAESVRRYPDKAALMYKDSGGRYTGITYGELDEMSDRLAASLRRLGVSPGDRLAIVSYHGPRWVIVDLAAVKLGAAVVPIYHTLTPSAMSYILSDAGCSIVFVENALMLAAVNAIKGDLPALETVVMLEDEAKRGSCVYFSDLLEEADPAQDASFRPADVSPGDTATIVYTSGTTGEPKGVILSHGNITSNSLAAGDRFALSRDDSFLSFLPLCHMFEKTCGYYAMLFRGVTVAYAGDLTTIVDDVQAIRPTILITVPRVVEKIYEAVEKKVLESSLVKRKMVYGSIRVLNERTNREYRGERLSSLLRLRSALADKLVASKFRMITGGRVRILVSGGAPLDRSLAKTLLVLGFNILEGYGLTEASPIVASALPGDNRLGTVGRPIAGVEIKIGEADEILVKGPNVMQGYFNKPEETAKAVDPEGWLHTGDQGRFDDQGNLVITGRIKELIVTSYGKNIAPVPIEAEIAKSPFIDQALLYGDNRKYITALIVPEKCAIEEYARERNLMSAGYEELLKSAGIRELISGEIERATAQRARYEKVKEFSLVPETFTVANKLLTPTLKLRRKSVIEKYSDQIEAMYHSQNGGQG